MLTFQDCLGLSELTEAEVEAIAEHEHIPEIIAAELGHYLVITGDGQQRIRRIILDDIVAATARGDQCHAIKLKLALRHFCQNHPACLPATAESVRRPGLAPSPGHG